MAKKILNILVLFNGDSNFLEKNKQTSIIDECIPSGSCDTNVQYLCTQQPEELAQFIADNHIHVIIYFSLSKDLLFSGDSYNSIPAVVFQESYIEVFGNKSVGRKLIHEAIKPVLSDIDFKLSWPTVIIAKTKDELDYLVDRSKRTPIGLDTETNFLNPFLREPEPKLVCFSAAFQDDEDTCWAVPTCDKLIKDAGCSYMLEESLQCASDIFFESKQAQYWQNGHYDLLVLWELFNGRQPKNFMCDSMLLLSIYHKAMKPCGLANNVTLVGLPKYKDAAKEWLKANQSHSKSARKLDFSDVPAEIILPYAAIDALAVVRLVNFMKKALTPNQWKFYFNIAHPIVETSIDLCIDGYEVSRDRLNYAKLEVEKAIKETYDWVMEIAGDNVDKAVFNVNSNDHMGKLLFEKLNMPVLSKTKKGAPAVGASTLDGLILFHPIIFAIQKLKKTVKLYTSYIKSYSNALGSGTRHQKYTGKRYILNCQLRQTNRTARLSSTNMTGWSYSNTKTKGGSLLTLPGTGSMVKSYFEPVEVVEKENMLYDEILESLKEDNPDEYLRLIEVLSQDATKQLKPPSKSKKPK